MLFKPRVSAPEIRGRTWYFGAVSARPKADFRHLSIRSVEYSAPEALQLNASGKLQQVDSRSDMWSLGMILHKLIFFRLPYPHIDPTDVNGIEREVLAYPGWKAAADPSVVASCKRRGLPRELLLLLEGLLCRNPRERPSSERVLSALKEGNVCGANDAHDCCVDHIF